MSDGLVLPAQLFLTLLMLLLLRMVMRFYPDVWRLTSQFNEFSLSIYVLLVEASSCLFRCNLFAWLVRRFRSSLLLGERHDDVV